MNFFCFWLSVGVLSSVLVVSQQKTIPITPNEVVRDKCLELCSVESKRNHYLFQQCLIDCNNNIPGPPMIKDIDGVVYKIFWEPANSSRIQIYSLEGLYSKTSDIFAELIELEEEQEKEALENPGAANEQFVEEPYVKSDNWKVVCNTTETYCKMEDLYQQNILSFRVRAMNLKGWGPYVYSRQPIEEPTDRGHLIIATFLPAILVCTSVFFCFIYVCISKLHKRRVRHKRDTLPHWAQFHQVEYAFPRILTDSEIGILPEFQDTNLKNLKYLGRGIFSTVQVFQGIILTDEKPTPVTIKKLQNGATDNLKRVFYQEAFILNNFNHDNILKLIGVSFGHTVNIALEDISKRKNLLTYLRSTTMEPSEDPYDEQIKIEKPKYRKLLGFCKDAASACAYLERNSYVHRDIACRSFYMFENDDKVTIKLADFTVINSENKSDFFDKHGTLYPIRWMAPESLHYGMYTIKTNVWAFGVTCWEIMTYGSQPYQGKDIYDVINFVRNGKRLDCPEICSKSFYEFLISTWRPDSDCRPSFKSITTNLLYL